ncbi:MAG: hypothetical protein M3R31_11650 [Pseudomonadota bacterium]|nr:hypothetical protein [Pseudomonadota bacterium]
MTASRRRSVVAALALCGCSADPYRLDTERGAAGMELSPYALREECIALQPGERIGFYFISATPVAFNIHYHDANAVIMPIVREHATRESGDFTADRREIYCLTWEAGAEPSILEYRVRPLPAR